MYDYYEMIRQQQTTNSRLQTVNDNLTIISQNQDLINQSIKEASILIAMILLIYLLYKFIERCFR